jgi:hypothetical protein
MLFYIALIWFSNYCKLGPFFTCHGIFDVDGDSDDDSDDDMESGDDGYIQVEDQGRGDAKLSNAAAKSTRMSPFLTISSKKANNGLKHGLNSQRICQAGSTSFSGMPSQHSQERRLMSCKSRHFLVDGGRNCTYKP